MCGLVAVFDLTDAKREISGSLLQAMNNSLAHRGPDGEGMHVERGLGLAHRRLSILDLSEAGKQPLCNEDGTVWVVFNGEIYNYEAIADELRSLGHVFRSRCDTEVIVHAWEEWGAESISRFRGMFALVLWDRNSNTIFAARDRMGIKPLYYGVTEDNFLVFASELKAIERHPGMRRTLNEQAVEEYFAYGYVPDPLSIYTDVSKLSPGHTLTAKCGDEAIKVRQYWDVSFDVTSHDPDELLGDVRDWILDAVRARLISDVPIGAFLSGGVDSSAVVAAMAQAADDPVRTCTVSFGERQYDESHFARMVANQWRTEHIERSLDAERFDIIDKLASVYDEPFADSSALPTYLVCEEARRHATVVLSGDGGDEVFAGYRRYRWHSYEEMVRSRLPRGLRAPLFGALGRAYPKLDWAPKPLRAKTTLQAIARDCPDAYFNSVSILPEGVRDQVFSEGFRRRLGGYNAKERLRMHMESAPTDNYLSRVQYADMKTYLPGDILTKVDRASMAHGLEVRVPLLDHDFVTWAGSVPSEAKLRGREGKAVLKKAVEPWLPADVLYREKMGFSVPLSDWLRGPLNKRAREAILHPRMGDSGFFDMRGLETLLEAHTSGRRDYSAPIWALMSFAAFLERSEASAPAAVAA